MPMGKGILSCRQEFQAEEFCIAGRDLHREDDPAPKVKAPSLLAASSHNTRTWAKELLCTVSAQPGCFTPFHLPLTNPKYTLIRCLARSWNMAVSMKEEFNI